LSDEHRAASPLIMRLEYTAREAVAYIAGLTLMQFVGALILVSGLMLVVLTVCVWVYSTLVWWLAPLCAIGIALGLSGITAMQLVNREPVIRSRIVGIGEIQARRVRAPAEKTGSDADTRPLVVNTARADARIDKLASELGETRLALANLINVLSSAQPQQTTAVAAEQPEGPELPPQPQAPRLPAARRMLAMPLGRAGLTRRQWRTLLCDIAQRQNTTYARIQEICGIGHTRAETVREALVDAGICRKTSGDRPQLELVEDYRQAILAELERLEGHISVPFRSQWPQIPAMAHESETSKPGERGQE